MSETTPTPTPSALVLRQGDRALVVEPHPMSCVGCRTMHAFFILRQDTLLCLECDEKRPGQ